MLVELSTNPAGYLRAAFRFSAPRRVHHSSFIVHHFLGLAYDNP